MGWRNATPSNARAMLDQIGAEWAVFAKLRDQAENDKQLAEIRAYVRQGIEDRAGGSSAREPGKGNLGGHLKDVSRDRHQGPSEAEP